MMLNFKSFKIEGVMADGRGALIAKADMPDHSAFDYHFYERTGLELSGNLCPCSRPGKEGWFEASLSYLVAAADSGDVGTLDTSYGADLGDRKGFRQSRPEVRYSYRVLVDPSRGIHVLGESPKSPALDYAGREKLSHAAWERENADVCQARLALALQAGEFPGQLPALTRLEWGKNNDGENALLLIETHPQGWEKRKDQVARQRMTGELVFENWPRREDLTLAIARHFGRPGDQYGRKMWEAYWQGSMGENEPDVLI